MASPPECAPCRRSWRCRSRTVGDVPARRPPRFLPFILTGAVIGFVVGAFLASRPDEVANRTVGTYSSSSAIGYLGFGCAALGALLAAVVAIVLERRSTRAADRG